MAIIYVNPAAKRGTTVTALVKRKTVISTLATPTASTPDHDAARHRETCKPDPKKE